MDAEQINIENRKYWIEVWKILSSVLTPLVLAFLTYVINNAIQERGAALKREEQVLNEKQRIYSEIGKRLNIFYVYIADVGDFRAYEPPRVVELKRETDRQFFMYRPYWTAETEGRYNEFMNAAFQTYNGAGIAARIRTSRAQKVSSYVIDKIKWNPEWDTYFTEESDPEIAAKYNALVSSIISDTVSASTRRP